MWGRIFKLTPRSQEKALFQLRKGKIWASVQRASVWVAPQGVSPHSDFSRDLQILPVKVGVQLLFWTGTNKCRFKSHEMAVGTRA